MNVTRIRQARRMAGLTLLDVSKPLGIHMVRLSLMERGEVPVPPGLEKRILIVIERLSHFDETVARKKKAVVADLRSAVA